MNGTQPLVSVENLTKHFPVMRGIIIQRKVGAVRAVDGISFTIDQGETLGLVGESGCGKTTAGRTLLGLYPATAGGVVIDGHNVRSAKGREMLLVRRIAQMIFQDPYASLNPRWTVHSIVSEPLRVHHLFKTEAERVERVQELMGLVGLSGRLINRFRMNSRVVSANGSAWRAPWHQTRDLLFATNPFLHWTFPSRLRW